jgi:hypothetical protein
MNNGGFLIGRSPFPENAFFWFVPAGADQCEGRS